MGITIRLGNELTDETIDFMARCRVAEYGTNTKNFKLNEQTSVFFFVQESNNILSFGMLKPVTIRFQQADYGILGIGNIMAVQKGRGHGRVLMNAVATHLRQTGKTGIGFCDTRNVCGFYRTCGYAVADTISHRFLYHPEGQESAPAHLPRDRSVLYLEPSGGTLMALILESEDPITVNAPFW